MDGTARARVEAEVREAFDAYERALVANDVEALIALFRPSPETVRMTDAAGRYGIDAIAGFRRARDPSDVARALTRVTVVALTEDVAVATAQYRRTGSGRTGAQSQTWLRTADGWRIAAAHVSLGA